LLQTVLPHLTQLTSLELECCDDSSDEGPQQALGSPPQLIADKIFPNFTRLRGIFIRVCLPS
jgi:hypothetical protein